MKLDFLAKPADTVGKFNRDSRAYLQVVDRTIAEINTAIKTLGARRKELLEFRKMVEITSRETDDEAPAVPVDRQGQRLEGEFEDEISKQLEDSLHTLNKAVNPPKK